MSEKDNYQEKRFAVMSEDCGELELRVLSNKEDFDEYNQSLEKNNKTPELYFEIPTSKTPYQVISEFKKRVPESKGLIAYSPDRTGFSSIRYLAGDNEDKYSFKESFIKYISDICPWNISF